MSFYKNAPCLELIETPVQLWKELQPWWDIFQFLPVHITSYIAKSYNSTSYVICYQYSRFNDAEV